MSLSRLAAFFLGLQGTVLVVNIFSGEAALILAVVGSLFLAGLSLIAEIFS